MRLWPFRSRSRYVISATPPDDLLVMEELLRRSVEDILVVRERELRGLSVAFGGELLVSPPRALERLEARFKPFGYTPFLREERDNVWVQAIPLAAVTEAGTPWVNGLLFLATCVSTVWAGAGVLSGFRTFNPFAHPALMTASMVFALTLLLILVTHEFGHYFTARYYHASVSLPYFIPAPPPFIFGTLGAIIKMRSPARDRNSLFDIAVAGPLAGLAIAIPAILVGLSWGRVVAVPPDAHEPMFGDSLLMRFLVYLTFGSIPAGMDVGVHPVGLAGWVGLFVDSSSKGVRGDVLRAAGAGGRHPVVELDRVGRAPLLPRRLPPQSSAERRDPPVRGAPRPRRGLPRAARASDPAGPHRHPVSPAFCSLPG
ncbi:MAG: site-2 protease family protein [Candidatus Rokubacteria bacterium]|nr:site-2 protease family protein [Candidatus Rokubacteria bacterium]